MSFSLMVCKIYKTFKNVQQPQKNEYLWLFMNNENFPLEKHT